MVAKRRELAGRLEHRNGETAEEVRQEAKILGVDLYTESAFATPAGNVNVIGPDDNLDNPYAACRPVFLHGMESGTLTKLVEGSFQHLMQAAQRLGVSETAVSRELDAYCAFVARSNCKCSNVELGSHPLTPMPYGISEYIRTGRTLDGNKRVTMARLMHGYLATTHLLTRAERRKHCELYLCVFQCREVMLHPINSSELTQTQRAIDDMDRRLVEYLVEFSPSACCSEKHHQWSHYASHRRQLGVTAMEMAFEHTFAVGFKKLVAFTNKSKVSKAEQTATKFWFRTGVRRLTGALGLREPLHPQQVVGFKGRLN